MAETIELFLMDDSLSGSIRGTVEGRIEVIYKIPRTQIESFKNREDLSNSGVYFLVGTSNQSSKDVIYVGQAGNRKNGDGILARLLEHKKNPDKNYWTAAIVLTTKSNDYGATELNFLEHKFYNLAKAANRCEVRNKIDAPLGNIAEGKEHALEKSVHYARLILGALGHKFFEPLAEKVSAQNSADTANTFHLSRKLRNLNISVEATARQTAEGFVVLKGSQISGNEDDNIPQIVKNARSESKLGADNMGVRVLLEDVLFPNPSRAAMFVIGKSANGFTEWKNASGTLKDFESNG